MRNLVANTYRLLKRRLKGQDLLEQVWHERDDTQIETLRERIRRLMVLEKSLNQAAVQLKEAGLVEAAKAEEEKAQRLHERIEELLGTKNIVELRVVEDQARYYREGMG